MRLILFFCITALLVSVNINAQKQSRHEFTVHGAAGLSSLQYKLSQGHHTSGFGGNAGLGYQYFLSPSWSLNTGIEVAWYRAETALDSICGSIPETYGTESFTFNYNFKNYHETQKVMLLSIPIMAQFQTEGKHKFFVAAGMKIGLPIQSSYSYDINKVNTSGYFKDLNITLGGPAFMGFGEFEDQKGKQGLSLHIVYMGAAEAGMKWSLARNKALYTGLYVDYSFNSSGIVNEASGKQLLEYNHADPPNFIHNTVLSPQYNNKQAIMANNRIHAVAAGVKIKMAIGK